MTNNKNSKFHLENYSNIFLQLGLVLSLFISYTIVESKSLKNKKIFQTEIDLYEFIEEEPIITKRAEVSSPKIVKKQFPIFEIKEDANDKPDEQVIEMIEQEQGQEDFIESITELEIEEEIEKDVLMINLVQKVPVFPGCEGNNQELKDCFNKKMQQHFQKKFDADLPNELGLSPGKKRVIMIFKIDKTGNVTDVMTKAPHPMLDKEAHRIIKLLPKMDPGIHQGEPVGVRYTLPMRIDVD